MRIACSPGLSTSLKIFLIVSLLTLTQLTFAQKETSKTSQAKSLKFDFGKGTMEKGYTKVLPETKYTPESGYGIDHESTVTANSQAGKVALQDGYLTSKTPFYFSVKVPEGNYRVKVTVGDDEGTSEAAIRAESRRMMVNRIRTNYSQHSTIEFTLHIRDSLIHGTNRKVSLKEREYTNLHWDDKLTLEFNGQEPKVNAIEITPEQPGVVSVFLAGNSTVVDGGSEPYSAWGQMIPAFFEPGKVSIANYAEGGETLSSFIGRRRFEKMLSLMKKGDYAFVEFGHNDQKQKGKNVGAFTTYKKNLEYFIAEVKKKGGIPVLVTSVQRRRFDSTGKIVETLGDYPAAVRQTAKEQNLPLVDLNVMSKTMYEAWGPEESLKAFVHFSANTYPGQAKALADNSHFSPFGAYEVAKLVLKGIRDNRLGIADFIFESVPEFDPAKPGSYASFYWPLSRSKDSVKPDGN
jgi:lysophospholipase L1-like esterase